MSSAMSTPRSDDVSAVVILLDVNPYFWGTKTSTGFTFEQFFQHVLVFINCILLLSHLNQVTVIAMGASACTFLYDSAAIDGTASGRSKRDKQPESRSTTITQKLQEFVKKDGAAETNLGPVENQFSNLSGSLSMALCYIQRILRKPTAPPQPRILCVQGFPDAPQQYIAVMNSIFSAQRCSVPIDACIVGSQHSAFLQQASHITGGIYMKPPQPEGLFQYLTMVFATDLYSRQFLQLPRSAGVDFRASCFCHKRTIDMGFVCSVCLSIFCKHHKACSTCGANFNVKKGGQKRKHPSS
ncbi:hypothetical protein CY35_05G122500 [Sphagnum magellanicum]|nr:hypothetical protein CY35_05G122500 [Sphagnum magellanicum]